MFCSILSWFVLRRQTQCCVGFYFNDFHTSPSTAKSPAGLGKAQLLGPVLIWEAQISGVRIWQALLLLPTSNLSDTTRCSSFRNSLFHYFVPLPQWRRGCSTMMDSSKWKNASDFFSVLTCVSLWVLNLGFKLASWVWKYFYTSYA